MVPRAVEDGNGAAREEVERPYEEEVVEAIFVRGKDVGGKIRAQG